VIDEDGNVIAVDPRTAVERASAPLASLDDKLLVEATESDLLPPDLAAAHASPESRAAGKQTRAQKLSARLIQEALALRAQGFAVPEIAESLRVAPPTVVGWFAKHRRQLADTAVDDALEQTAVPLATENLIHGLLAGDKDYTLETLKGRGKLRRYSQGEQVHDGEIPALVVRIENADGSKVTAALGARPPAESAAAGGRIVGQPALPKTVEGEVVPNPGTGGENDGPTDG
jgi:hypothetical protein